MGLFSVGRAHMNWGMNNYPKKNLILGSSQKIAKNLNMDKNAS